MFYKLRFHVEVTTSRSGWFGGGSAFMDQLVQFLIGNIDGGTKVGTGFG
jgi:hypothetical protein